MRLSITDRAHLPPVASGQGSGPDTEIFRWYTQLATEGLDISGFQGLVATETEEHETRNIDGGTKLVLHPLEEFAKSGAIPILRGRPGQ